MIAYFIITAVGLLLSAGVAVFIGMLILTIVFDEDTVERICDKLDSDFRNWWRSLWGKGNE